MATSSVSLSFIWDRIQNCGDVFMRIYLLVGSVMSICTADSPVSSSILPSLQLCCFYWGEPTNLEDMHNHQSEYRKLYSGKLCRRRNGKFQFVVHLISVHKSRWWKEYVIGFAFHQPLINHVPGLFFIGLINATKCLITSYICQMQKCLRVPG